MSDENASEGQRADPLDLKAGPASEQGPGRSFERRTVPRAGARSSPQIPGQTIDQFSVPGHTNYRVARTTTVRRPLTQFGTAQEIMGVYAPKPGQENDPARFEQASASYEELRKADPALLTPIRPLPGYDLKAVPATSAQSLAPGEIPALAEGTSLPADAPKPASS